MLVSLGQIEAHQGSAGMMQMQEGLYHPQITQITQISFRGLSKAWETHCGRILLLSAYV